MRKLEAISVSARVLAIATLSIGTISFVLALLVGFGVVSFGSSRMDTVIVITGLFGVLAVVSGACLLMRFFWAYFLLGLYWLVLVAVMFGELLVPFVLLLLYVLRPKPGIPSKSLNSTPPAVQAASGTPIRRAG